MQTEGISKDKVIRPKSIGDLLDQTFRAYRTHFAFLITVSVCVMLPYLVLSSVFNYKSVDSLQTMLSGLTHSHSLTDAFAAPDTTNSPLVAVADIVLGFVNWLVVLPLLYGAILHFVTRNQLFDERVQVKQGLAFSVRRWGSVVVTNVVLVILWIVVVGVVSVGVGLLVGLLSLLKAPTPLVIIVGILLGLAALCLCVYLTVKLSIASSVVREERRILWPSFVRSWVLVRQNFWRTFGYFVLLYIIVGVIQSGVNGLVYVVHSPILAVVVSSLLTLFTTPFLMLATANLYVDLRIRTDGLDLLTDIDN